MNKKYIKYINYIVNNIEKPYFKNMEEQYGVSQGEYESVLSKLLNQPIIINRSMYGNIIILDKDYNEIYFENSKGMWHTSEYDANDNLIYVETSDGEWVKTEWDENGNEVYRINEVGFWSKWDYDDNNNVIYYENSDGFWSKHTYDKDGNEIYYEDSRGIRHEI